LNKLNLFNVRALDPRLMKDMLACLDAMPPEQRENYSRRVFALIEIIEDLPAADPVMNCANILLAFEFRMEALLRLREQPEYHRWALQMGKGGAPDLIDETLIKAAAAQPLIESDHLPAFEPVAFFTKVLEVSKAAGQA